MPKAEWGSKRTCLTCAARFFDLMKDPIVCPKCGAQFDVAVMVKAKRMKVEKAVPVPVIDDEEDPIRDDEDEEDDLVEDDDDDEVDPILDEEEEEDAPKVVKKVAVARPDVDVNVDDDPVDEEDDLDGFEDDVLLGETEDDDAIEDLGDVPGDPKEEP